MPRTRATGTAQEDLDRALVQKLADVGYLAGWELDTASYALVMEELGRADSSVRGIVSVNVGLVGKTIAKWGTDEQKQEWLAKLGVGGGARLLRADGAGVRSDPSSLSTRAVRDGDDWVLSGSKIFITLGSWAGVALVFARTSDEGARGLTCFLVPTDSDGFSATRIKGKLGLRAQDTAELTLDGVRVPDANRLGAGGRRLQGGDVGARQRPHLARGRLRRHRAGLSRRLRRATPPSGSSSASRSRRIQLVQELIADIAVD